MLPVSCEGGDDVSRAERERRVEYTGSVAKSSVAFLGTPYCQRVHHWTLYFLPFIQTSRDRKKTLEWRSVTVTAVPVWGRRQYSGRYGFCFSVIDVASVVNKAHITPGYTRLSLSSSSFSLFLLLLLFLSLFRHSLSHH